LRGRYPNEIEARQRFQHLGDHLQLVATGKRDMLQGEVHKVEPMLSDPVDLCDWITGRMIHYADLHTSALPCQVAISVHSSGMIRLGVTGRYHLRNDNPRPANLAERGLTNRFQPTQANMVPCQMATTQLSILSC
jgi:hypothetical protein